MRQFTRLGPALAALGLLGLAGCANNEDMAALRADVDALEARVTAAEAMATEAQNSALRCTEICEDVQEQSERMFQQSLRK